jgi:putative chitinase
MLTLQFMRRFVPKCVNPQEWADELNAAFPIAGITTPRQAQHLMAQLFVECKGFTDFEEDLWYSADRLQVVWRKRFANRAVAEAHAGNPKALANFTYNGRMGNRVGSDDGWHFRGRAPKQITGRNNYTAFELWLAERGMVIDIRTRPELLLTPRVGALAVAWFWSSNNLNRALSNKNDVEACINLTQIINGGQTGIKDRQAALVRAKAVW